ncbi:MAG: ribulokinase [Ruminococcaceae bacterium]|nr:ribulokinase [Oscillospiraceae bacterium]
MAVYTIGVDFGSLSCRAVLVDTANGKELGVAVSPYRHGVMDTVLAANGKALPPHFVLQDPADYLESLAEVIPAVLKNAGVAAADVAGIGIDFTCCTLLPLDQNGTPLCFDAAFAENPYAYVRMWKDHSADAYAKRLNEVASRRGERWLSLCGGAMSAAFTYPKMYQTAVEAPEVYEAAHTFMESGDFITWQLTGNPVRGYLFAAFKSQYEKGAGYPSRAYFEAVDERLSGLLDKLPYDVLDTGSLAGRVSAEAAARFGLCEGTAVSVAGPDGHSAAGALGLCKSGDAFGIFGTSAPFFLQSSEKCDVPGISGMCADGVLPGFWGYEAGLCCFGDHFAYAAEHYATEECRKEAEARGISVLRLLSERAAKKAPGQTGLLALDWFSGNRNLLGDPLLSGVFVGMTLHTAPEDYMRALFEATAFATRVIFDAFAAAGVPIKALAASGGIARKDAFLMQLFADILDLPISVASTAEAGAHGSAICAAVAANVYESMSAAVEKMADQPDTVYYPCAENRAAYDALYAEYKRLHDYFGRGENNVMKTLRRLAGEKV